MRTLKRNLFEDRIYLRNLPSISLLLIDHVLLMKVGGYFAMVTAWTADLAVGETAILLTPPLHPY